MHLTHPYLLAFVWWHLLGIWAAVWHITKYTFIPRRFFISICIFGAGWVVIVPLIILGDWIETPGPVLFNKRTKP